MARDFRSEGTSFILNSTMKKRKASSLSATKMVKANARERIGQPKASRVVDSEHKQGRRAKYKDRMEELATEE